MKWIKLFPKSPVAKVLDYLEKIYPLDVTITDMINGSKISSSTMYESVIPALKRTRLLKQRKVGKQILYSLKTVPHKPQQIRGEE